MRTAESYLGELEIKLSEKVVLDWRQDSRFNSEIEMQKYNCGIGEAMNLVREMLNSEDFRNPLMRADAF